MKNRMLLALTVAGTLLSASAYAQTSTWSIDPAHSSVNFVIVHTGVSHVHGAFGNVKGTVALNDKDMTKSTVAATIDTTTVSTGVEARDKHLKSPDFFDAEKNPAMTFKSTSLAKMGGKMQLTGDLTISGVTKSVTLDLDGPYAAADDARQDDQWILGQWDDQAQRLQFWRFEVQRHAGRRCEVHGRRGDRQTVSELLDVPPGSRRAATSLRVTE